MKACLASSFQEYLTKNNMICHSCLRRIPEFASRRAPATRLLARSLATTAPARQASAAPSPAAAGTPPPPPPSADSAASKSPSLSTCVPGTVLNGLNFFKNKTDPVALPDEEYPAWLWNCLDVQKKASTEADDGAADEFSKSKKVRRAAAKKRRDLEAQILATGNLEALAPKIPLQQQSINLPGTTGGDMNDALLAAEQRAALTKAMRKERKAKIKESNYLKSMR